MVGYKTENTLTENGSVARGVCTADANGRLTSIVERTKIFRGDDGLIHYDAENGEPGGVIPEGTSVSMNLWGFDRSFLEEAEARFPAFLDKTLVENPLKGEYFLPSVVDQLIVEGKARVQVLLSEDKWHGITYREDKPSVTAAIAAMTESGLYPDELWPEQN